MRTRVDPAVFGAVLAVLWAAHDVGDHVVQTDRQAVRKSWPGRDGAWALGGHVASYTVVQLVAVGALRWWAGVRPSWWRTVVAVAFSAGSHALLDRRWPVVWVLRHTGSADFACAQIPRQRVTFTETAVGYSKRGMFPSVSYSGYVPEHPLPLHGPYLADQALHHGCLAVTAAILAGKR